MDHILVIKVDFLLILLTIFIIWALFKADTTRAQDEIVITPEDTLPQSIPTTTGATVTLDKMMMDPSSQFHHIPSPCGSPPSEHDDLQQKFYCYALLALWIMLLISAILYQMRTFFSIKYIAQLVGMTEQVTHPHYDSYYAAEPLLDQGGGPRGGKANEVGSGRRKEGKAEEMGTEMFARSVHPDWLAAVDAAAVAAAAGKPFKGNRKEDEKEGTVV